MAGGLNYCKRWVNRDVPNMRGKPALPPDIDHAARETAASTTSNLARPRIWLGRKSDSLKT